MADESRSQRDDALALETLILDVDDRVATVTLDAPKRRNAFTLKMVDEMCAVFDRLEADDEIGAVVITGRAPAFCAGADLSHLKGAAREGLRRIYEGFLRVARSSLPTVAAVNGAAVGAGMNLALACDVRIAGERAKFDCRFLDLGLHPGGGHTWMLRQIGGEQLVNAMVLFGQILDGAAAKEHGLAWDVAPDDELLERSRAVAARAASAPKPLVVEAKRTLADMAGVSHHDLAVERELGPQVWSIGEPFFAERLAAMKKKITKK
ncbi:MAG: enoyl-CoA hydratase [Acidobacteriota bacterium]